MVWATVAGVGAMIVGGAISSSSEKSGANKARKESEFSPYQVDTGYGGFVDFDKKNHLSRYNATDQEKLQYDMYGRVSLGAMRAAEYGANIQQQAYTQMGNQAEQYGRYSGAMDRGVINQLDENRRLAESQYGALTNQYNKQGNIADQAFAKAGGLLNQNYTGYAQDQLNLMRDASAQQETRDTYQLRQNLFSSGRMGTEGGARNIQAFNEAQEQNDMNRQMTAQTMAMQRQAADRGAAFNLANVGANASQAQQSMVGQGFGMMQGFSNTQMGMADNVVSRAHQRLGATQALMGFGQGFNTGAIGQSLQGLQAQSAMQQNATNQISLGSNVGAAASGANVAANSMGIAGGANQSILGGALSSFGGSLLGGGGGGLGGLLGGGGGLFG